VHNLEPVNALANEVINDGLPAPYISQVFEERHIDVAIVDFILELFFFYKMLTAGCLFPKEVVDNNESVVHVLIVELKLVEV